MAGSSGTGIMLAQQAVSKAGQGVKKVGDTIWQAGEETAPYIWKGAKKAGKKISSEFSRFAKDIGGYGLTRLDQYKKYRLLKTKKARNTFNRTIREFNQGVLKSKGRKVTSLRKAINIAMDRATLNESSGRRSIEKGERGMIVFDKFDVPSTHDYVFASMVKNNYPRLWDYNGGRSAETAFENLSKVVKRGYWLNSEEWMYRTWKSYKQKFTHNKTIPGVISNLKWMSLTPKQEEIVKSAIEFQKNKKKMMFGGQVENNDQGGYTYTGDNEIRASKTDLITLPERIEGTNCFNCTYIVKENDHNGICWHPEVDLPVTKRMCCALWDNPGVKRSWNKMARGGMSYGPTHEQGGITFEVKSTGQNVELEGAGIKKDKKGRLIELDGGEGVINVKNMQKDDKFIITEPLSVRDMASCLNEIDGNGVNFRKKDGPCPVKKVG